MDKNLILFYKTETVDSQCPGSIRASAQARPPTKRITSNNSYAHDDQGDNPGQETKGSMVSSINCDGSSLI